MGWEIRSRIFSMCLLQLYRNVYMKPYAIFNNYMQIKNIVKKKKKIGLCVSSGIWAIPEVSGLCPSLGLGAIMILGWGLLC